MDANKATCHGSSKDSQSQSLSQSVFIEIQWTGESLQQLCWRWASRIGQGKARTLGPSPAQVRDCGQGQKTERFAQGKEVWAGRGQKESLWSKERGRRTGSILSEVDYQRQKEAGQSSKETGAGPGQR